MINGVKDIRLIKIEKDVEYSLVVPLFNEELVIRESYSKLKKVMNVTGQNYEIVFVNDGSHDTTKEIVEGICRKDEKVKLVNFSRNFGHQVAISAGMDIALGKAVIVIDADLQDPPEVILEMIEKWKEGYEVVYGKRIKREGETFFKKFTAKTYYRLLKSLTSVDIPVDTGDFRLIDRKVCNALTALPEKNRYIRGMVSWVGFKQTYVEYTRHERFAGETKYPLKKMMKLAFDGITGFSLKPLMIASYLGVISLIIGSIGTLAQIINSSVNNTKLLGIGIILPINFIMFGLLSTCMGIMGLYIGRIFDESKDRPLYIIEDVVCYGNEEKKYDIG